MFCFKQKTAYEMRMSDWSSDVCASDLRIDTVDGLNESIAPQLGYGSFAALLDAPGDRSILVLLDNREHVVDAAAEAVAIGRASCRGRGWQYVYNWVVAVSSTKTTPATSHVVHRYIIFT